MRKHGKMEGQVVMHGWWGNGTVSAASKKKKPLYQDSLNPFYNNQTNWYKYATRTANVKNVNLQVSGGATSFNTCWGQGIMTKRESC